MLIVRLRQTTRIENNKWYYLKHVKGIEKWKRLIICSVGEDMEPRHSHMLWVGKDMGIALLLINLTTSIHTANRYASLPRNPLLATPG